MPAPQVQLEMKALDELYVYIYVWEEWESPTMKLWWALQG